ncbi:single-stranded DNA-binding protein [Bifidobacterium lemurum]|uniref:Single-stranded DNA-binding protein n=1 Tax=Bifidobacterium lemurum TaxID=1603886 RepID=A0A261FRU8_9BIFI|nr:single-stranded DNA-binding protein [Bifidobacterium lemurum]OZG61914.1 single-stranded DNA-binding protein [Bifidobacterium lemurum]QOL33294.1 single-stranded DNA-binding protein [Bifidobacterium lemurum]
MAGETTITIVGNLTSDPELRTIGSGATVASFTIASTPRTYNRQTGQWDEGQALFMRCSAWRDLADHCAQSLTKGMRVIATGRLQQRSYQANDGSNRTVVEMQIDEIGPSLRYATAQVTRQSSGQGGFQGRGAQGGQGFGGNAGAGFAGGNGGYQGGAGYSGGASAMPSNPAAAPAADPWGNAGGSGGFSTFGGSADFGGESDEPEF